MPHGIFTYSLFLSASVCPAGQLISTKNPECESVRDFTFYLLPIHYYLEPHSGIW